MFPVFPFIINFQLYMWWPGSARNTALAHAVEVTVLSCTLGLKAPVSDIDDTHSFAGRSGPGTFPAPLKWLCQAGFSPWFFPPRSLMYIQLPGPPLWCWTVTIGSCFGFFQMFPLSSSILSLSMFLSQRGTWGQVIASLSLPFSTHTGIFSCLLGNTMFSFCGHLPRMWMVVWGLNKRKKKNWNFRTIFFFHLRKNRKRHMAVLPA